MSVRMLAALLTFAAFAAAAEHGPVPSTVPDAADAYLASLADLEKQGGTTQSVEPLYALALKLQEDLMAITHDYARIEGLSDADFAQLQQRLRGFRLSRGLDVFAEPDPAFLLDLAASMASEPTSRSFRCCSAPGAPICFRTI